METLLLPPLPLVPPLRQLLAVLLHPLQLPSPLLELLCQHPLWRLHQLLPAAPLRLPPRQLLQLLLVLPLQPPLQLPLQLPLQPLQMALNRMQELS